MRCDPRLVAGRDGPAVFALRALGLGDLMTAIPALIGLRRSRPEGRLVLGTSGFLAPLVETFDFVDEMIPVEPLQELPVQFDRGDVVVNLHGRGPESTRLLVDAGAEHLIAFSHPDVPATVGLARWQRREHEVTRWCRLLRWHGIDARTGDVTIAAPPQSPAPTLEGATILHPGAGAPARRWPPPKWAALARWLRSRGQTVVITGGDSEVARANWIAETAGVPHHHVAAGRTDVRQLAGLISVAGLLVASDTGPAHLASAYRTPSVVLFGPTSPDEWGPPDHPRHRTVWAGPRSDPNGAVLHEGLAGIEVQDVIGHIEQLDMTGELASRLVPRVNSVVTGALPPAVGEDRARR